MSQQSGVVFPKDEAGRRSSLHLNQQIWADSVRNVDEDLADEITATPDWRHEYVDLVRRATVVGAASRSVDQRIATDGLASAHQHLQFERDDEVHPLSAAAKLPEAFTFDDHRIIGKAEPLTEVVVPYQGRKLRGDALRRRLAGWVSDGLIEPSAASAINTVMENPEWLRMAGRRVVVYGAGAQTSPLPVLTRWGVEAIAVDLPHSPGWEGVIEAAEAGAGTVHIPIRGKRGKITDRIGANVIEDVPELTRWLSTFDDKPLTLGFYIYADGPLHIRATLAADLVGQALGDAGLDVSYAFTGTPSDCYLVSNDVVEDSNLRRRARPRRAFELAMRTATLGNLYAPAYQDVVTSLDGEVMGVADAIVAQQGPNYSLAKHLQRWRTIAQWQANETASFNVAPPTWTTSVTKNKLLAAGYYGARSAGLEVFAPSTMKVLMTALMIHDHHVEPYDEHPELAISRDAVHGGYWRVPHEIKSTLMFTMFAGIPKAYLPATFR